MGENTKETKNISADRKSSSSGVKFGLRLKFGLAVIFLVTSIVVTISIYFTFRESRLLKEQVFQFMDREMVHLSNIAQQSIGIDELALISAANDLKKIPHISYAFILNKNDSVIQYFDRRADRKIGEPLADGVKRDISGAGENIRITQFDDPADKSGIIYDFSMPVLNKIDKAKIGYVVIGLSDIIIRKEVDTLRIFMFSIAMVFLGVSAAGAVILSMIIIRPIRKLSEGAAIIGSGNLDYSIPIKSSDELGQLAREFNQMTVQIKEAKEKEIGARIMEEQIETAKEIQEGLNPSGFYNKNGIQIKGFTRAAKGVGGDYFDYSDIDEFRIGTLISDVSGKGVPASLVMVMIRTVFTSLKSRKDASCSTIVTAINDSLSADFAIDKFATLFFMIYDRRTGEMSFSNAGHGPLFRYRASKNECVLYKIDGVPIGIMEDAEYPQAKVQLEPGDLVVLYTDGVTEMRNSLKEEYGRERLQKFVMDYHSMDAKDFIAKLVDDIDSFRGGVSPHDDMTMLVFKRVD